MFPALHYMRLFHLASSEPQVFVLVLMLDHFGSTSTSLWITSVWQHCSDQLIQKLTLTFHLEYLDLVLDIVQTGIATGETLDFRLCSPIVICQVSASDGFSPLAGFIPDKTQHSGTS
uniref:Uncharacterized protein n=1 Tax=Pyxicephalus adspersus TaxID=30357 RepID=A0AAV3A892_PYXAD|nr:TPA: hypothetical protein GDO54_011572 [Pyxicephalus adspersus]